MPEWKGFKWFGSIFKDSSGSKTVAHDEFNRLAIFAFEKRVSHLQSPAEEFSEKQEQFPKKKERTKIDRLTLFDPILLTANKRRAVVGKFLRILPLAIASLRYYADCVCSVNTVHGPVEPPEKLLTEGFNRHGPVTGRPTALNALRGRSTKRTVNLLQLAMLFSSVANCQWNVRRLMIFSRFDRWRFTADEAKLKWSWRRAMESWIFGGI